MTKQVRGREVEEERGRECEGCDVGSMPSSATTNISFFFLPPLPPSTMLFTDAILVERQKQAPLLSSQKIKFKQWAKNGTLCEDKGLFGTLPAHFLAILYAAVHPAFLDYSLVILVRQHRDCERAQGIK